MSEPTKTEQSGMPNGVRVLVERLKDWPRSPPDANWRSGQSLMLEAASRLAELTKERDEAVENLDEALVWQDVALERQRRAEAAEASLSRLKSDVAGVLGPFAEAHANRPDLNDAHPDYDRETIWESPSAMCLEYGHLRAAAALLSSISGGEVKEEYSSSRPTVAAADLQSATEAQHSAGGGDNHELFTDFREPLRGDLIYVEAALSYYWGGPASADVRTAWDRVLANLREVRSVSGEGGEP